MTGPRERSSPVTRSTSFRRGRPLRATILAQVRADTPVSAASASGASSSLASRRGRQPLSAIGSPRRTRANHLETVCRLTPAIAAASETRMPPPTHSQSSALPLGVNLALGCWDMGGPLAVRLDNSQHAGGLPICHCPGVNNLLAQDRSRRIICPISTRLALPLRIASEMLV